MVGVEGGRSTFTVMEFLLAPRLARQSPATTSGEPIASQALTVAGIWSLFSRLLNDDLKCLYRLMCTSICSYVWNWRERGRHTRRLSRWYVSRTSLNDQ